MSATTTTTTADATTNTVDLTILNTLLRHKRLPLVPPSHWTETLGDSHANNIDQYITAISSLQTKLINYIRRPSRCINLHPVDERGNSLFGEEFHLRHDDKLCKFWKYLAIAMIHRDDCPIDSFRVMNVQLVPCVMKQLGRALEGSRDVKTLILIDVDFGREGLGFVSQVLGGNPNLKCLSLNSNNLDFDVEGCIIPFANVLRDHGGIESLSLRYCTLGFGSGGSEREEEEDDIHNNNSQHGRTMMMTTTTTTTTATITGLSAILSALHTNIKFLDLRNTSMSSEGATTIAQYLSTNPHLETLNLSNNNFNDIDATILSTVGLSKSSHSNGTNNTSNTNNTNLKTLYLTNNPNIGPIGKVALLKCIFDASSLDALVDSNHTCEVIFDKMHTVHDMVMLINNFAMRSTNRKRKIVFAMHDALIVGGRSCNGGGVGRGNSVNDKVNNDYFKSLESVPVQLASDVLGLVQFGPLRYMSSRLMYNHSFTLTFEIMRRWLCGFLGG